MKAAILHQAGAPLVIEEIDKPQPGSGEILIQVKACGVCHTELHSVAGEWRLPKLPLVLGHEAVGVATAVGVDVKNFKAGDRADTLVLVGLPPGNFTLPIRGSVAKGIRVLTSAVGTRQDLREVLALAASGKIKTVGASLPLQEINGAFNRMRAGTISGRLVVEFH